MTLKKALFSLCFLLIACSKDSYQPPVNITGIAPLSGPKTTVLTITGSGFSSNAAENVVTLNEFPCPVISASNTELKVTYTG